LTEKNITLPVPKTKGEVSLEEALTQRATQRTFSLQEITLKTVVQLLWALQGTTKKEQVSEEKVIYHRAAPTPGRSYPLVVHLVME